MAAHLSASIHLLPSSGCLFLSFFFSFFFFCVGLFWVVLGFGWVSGLTELMVDSQTLFSWGFVAAAALTCVSSCYCYSIDSYYGVWLISFDGIMII